MKKENKKFIFCKECHKRVLRSALSCTHCKAPIPHYKYATERGSKPLTGLKYGSITVIISVTLFSFMMWGVIEFFSAIGDFFKY